MLGKGIATCALAAFLTLAACGNGTSASVATLKSATTSANQEQKSSQVQEEPVEVTISVEAKGLDKKGTRIPVRVTGTTGVDSKSLDETAYLEADGTGLKLVTGTYEVKAVGSPITSDGAVFVAPLQTVKVVVEDGKAKADGLLTFEPMPAKTTTDEQVQEALEFAKADKERAKGADVLAKKAVERAHKARTVSFRDFDFVLPVAWVDRVEFKEDDYEQWLEWNGWRMLTRLSDGVDVSMYPTQEQLELEDDVTVSIIKGNDWMLDAQLEDIDGRKASVYVQLADPSMLGLSGRSEDELTAYREFQVTAAGCSADSSPEEVATALLHECVKGMTLTGEPDLSAYTIDMGTYHFVLPKPWRKAVSVREHETQRWIMYDGDVLCMLGIMKPGSDDEWVEHVGVLDSFTRDDGIQAQIVEGEDWTLHGKLMVGLTSWPRVSIVMPDALRDKESRGEKHANTEEFLNLQRAVANVDESASEEDVAKECLRACLQSVELSSGVDPERLAEFEQRRREIDDLPNTDRRFAGTMSEMRQAGVDRLSAMVELVNDMRAYLGECDRVDVSQLNEVASRADALEQPHSGNAYALEAISASTEEAEKLLDFYFALAYAAL